MKKQSCTIENLEGPVSEELEERYLPKEQRLPSPSSKTPQLLYENPDAHLILNGSPFFASFPYDSGAH